jgi:exodeoxyribonuclease VII large subunit
MANEQPLFSVSGLLASINQTLEYAYPAIEVEGEVASFKVNQNKFVFFDIKDDTGSIGCFMTVWQLRVPVEDGMKVIIRAIPKLTPWGKFSLTVQSIRPTGEGSLKKSFELLKHKLEAEGLFGLERKRPLPELPQHIGVISSTGAAGYTDFITILNDRWGGMKVDVAHVQVQGEVAADQIIRAIRYFNEQAQLPEVLVLVRGGGSADDLSVFNDELLVRELAASRVPTLVGVGHEIDETLADLVADMRASTPSNAAQLIVPDKREVVAKAWHSVQLVVSRTEQSLGTVRRHMQAQLALSVGRILEKQQAHERHLDSSRAQLEAYNPTAVLRRGYALMRGEAKVGAQIEIETIHNIIKAEVRHVAKSNN